MGPCPGGGSWGAWVASVRCHVYWSLDHWTGLQPQGGQNGVHRDHSCWAPKDRLDRACLGGGFSRLSQLAPCWEGEGNAGRGREYFMAGPQVVVDIPDWNSP